MIIKKYNASSIEFLKTQIPTKYEIPTKGDFKQQLYAVMKQLFKERFEIESLVNTPTEHSYTMDDLEIYNISLVEGFIGPGENEEKVTYFKLDFLFLNERELEVNFVVNGNFDSEFHYYYGGVISQYPSSHDYFEDTVDLSDCLVVPTSSIQFLDDILGAKEVKLLLNTLYKSLLSAYMSYENLALQSSLKDGYTVTTELHWRNTVHHTITNSDGEFAYETSRATSLINYDSFWKILKN